MIAPNEPLPQRMSAHVLQKVGTVSTRALLSPFGIGLSRHVTVVQRRDNRGLALQASGNVASGSPLLVLSDSNLLTSQTAFDADVDGLVPPPADMLEMLQGQSVRLDEVYLAYYLSLRYFTTPNDWYALQLDFYRDAPAAAAAGDDSVVSALWERASREHVSAPRPLFLAALRYVRASSFYKPVTAAAADGAAAPSQPAPLAVAPVLDVAVRGRDRGEPTALLTSCTAKDVTEKYLSADLRGARQALVAKDDACAYWVLLARDNIPQGGAVSIASQPS